MRVVAGINRFGALGQPVKRRHGKIEMSVCDQLPHFSIEVGQQQRGDVRAVHIGIGHDDDALVAQIRIAIFGARAAA